MVRYLVCIMYVSFSFSKTKHTQTHTRDARRWKAKRQKRVPHGTIYRPFDKYDISGFRSIGYIDRHFDRYDISHRYFDLCDTSGVRSIRHIGVSIRYDVLYQTPKVEIQKNRAVWVLLLTLFWINHQRKIRRREEKHTSGTALPLPMDRPSSVQASLHCCSSFI